MSFYKRYELARLIHEDEVKTFTGFQTSSRRPIYLHLFAVINSRPAIGRLMQMVKQAEAAGQVIEAGEFGGTYYVVTDPIDRFTTLRDYLEANPPTKSKAGPATPRPATAPPVSPPLARPSQPPVRRTPPPVPFEPAPDPEAPAPSIFETWPAAGPPPAKVPGVPGPPPPGPRHAPLEAQSGLEVGEFTQLFGLDKPAANPVAAPPAQWPRAAGPPQSQPPAPPPPPVPPEPPAAVPATPEARPFGRPGQITRMFGPAPGGSASPQPAPFEGSTQPISDVSAIFGNPQAAPPPPAGRLPASPTTEGYQTMFGTQPSPGYPATTPQPPPLPASPAAAARLSRTNLILLIVGGAIGMIAAVLLVYWSASRG